MHQRDVPRKPNPRRCRWRRAASGAGLAGALLAPAVLALAQPCHGPLPDARTALPDGGEKFKLIARQCTVLDSPVTELHARSLDVYDEGASVTIHMAPALVPTAPDAVPAAPLGRDGLRVLAVAPELTDAARIHRVDPLLLHAIAHVESRHNAAAVSRSGARGLMQVMPGTGRRFGVDDPERSLMDPHANVQASAAYLSVLRRRYGDDWRLVLAAYNAGEGAVDKYGGVPPYPETQAYVREVLAVYRRLNGAFSVSPAGEITLRRPDARSRS